MDMKDEKKYNVTKTAVNRSATYSMRVHINIEAIGLPQYGLWDGHWLQTIIIMPEMILGIIY
jgi:hypothetical protein